MSVPDVCGRRARLEPFSSRGPALPKLEVTALTHEHVRAPAIWGEPPRSCWGVRVWMGPWDPFAASIHSGGAAPSMCMPGWSVATSSPQQAALYNPCVLRSLGDPRENGDHPSPAIWAARPDPQLQRTAGNIAGSALSKVRCNKQVRACSAAAAISGIHAGLHPAHLPTLPITPSCPSPHPAHLPILPISPSCPSPHPASWIPPSRMGDRSTAGNPQPFLLPSFKIGGKKEFL